MKKGVLFSLTIIFLIIYFSIFVFALESCSNREAWRRGDVNGDERTDITDAIFLLNYLFKWAGDISCLERGDLDDNKRLDITDAIFLLNYLFRGGDAPRGFYSWEDKPISENPLEIAFLYVDYVNEKGENIERPEMSLEIPANIFIGARAGSMKHCKLSAFLLNGGEEIILSEAGSVNSEVFLLNPYGVVIDESFGLQVGRDYLLKAMCEDGIGTKAESFLKVTIANSMHLLGLFPPGDGDSGISQVPSACCSITCSNGETTCAQTVKSECESDDLVKYDGTCAKYYVGHKATDIEWKENEVCDNSVTPPMCKGKSPCNVVSMKILRGKDDKIPKGFDKPELFLTEAQLSIRNQRLISIGKGNFAIPSAKDKFHNMNKPLGLVQGWSKGTDVSFKEEETKPDGSYFVTYGAFIVAELEKNSNPEECKEFEFIKRTSTSKIRKENAGGDALLIDIKESRYVGFVKDSSDEDMVDLENFDSYMHKESEVKQEKSLRQMELLDYNSLLSRSRTVDENTEEKIRNDPRFPQLSGFVSCWYEKDKFCQNNRKEQKNLPMSGGKGSFDIKKYLVEGEENIGSPKIVWFTHPGKHIPLKAFLIPPVGGFPGGFQSGIPPSSLDEYKASIFAVVEDAHSRVIEVDVGQTNPQLQVALNRWVCELEGIHIKSQGESDPSEIVNPERVKLIGEPKCKCYPQRKKSIEQLWERVKGNAQDGQNGRVNSEGYIEVIC